MLRGTAAVVIWTEIEDLVRHDAWHSGEHLHERLSIPGFLRGRRYAALDPANPEQRFIFYELQDIGVATSPPYLKRLNNPTPWSKELMQVSRLRRALCRVVESHGEGVGGFALVARLSQTVSICKTPGTAGAHLLQRDASVVRPHSGEEKMRRGGSDATADIVVIVEGFDLAAMRAAVHGQAWAAEAREYGLSHVLAREDI
jgi:hypothetical protein